MCVNTLTHIHTCVYICILICSFIQHILEHLLYTGTGTEKTTVPDRQGPILVEPTF